MFFPFLNTNTLHMTDEKSELLYSMPIILQHYRGNHWITMKLKKSHKMLWPRPSPNYWGHVCEQLGKDTSYKRSLWYRYLHFVDKNDIVPARIEDAERMYSLETNYLNSQKILTFILIIDINSSGEEEQSSSDDGDQDSYASA